MLDSKKKIMLLLGVYSILIISLFLLTLFLSRNKKTSLSPSPIATPTSFPIVTTIPLPDKTQLGFKGIYPGIDTEKSVLKKLGAPVKTELKNETKILYYPTTTKSEYFFNKIYVSKNVDLVLQEITKDDNVGKYEDFISRFSKEPDGVLYDQKNQDFQWYVFSKNGIALLANNAGFILTIQYFPPMEFENYLKTIAKDLSLSKDPPSQF